LFVELKPGLAIRRIWTVTSEAIVRKQGKNFFAEIYGLGSRCEEGKSGEKAAV